MHDEIVVCAIVCESMWHVWDGDADTVQAAIGGKGAKKIRQKKKTFTYRFDYCNRTQQQRQPKEGGKAPTSHGTAFTRNFFYEAQTPSLQMSAAWGARTTHMRTKGHYRTAVYVLRNAVQVWMKTPLLC